MRRVLIAAVLVLAAAAVPAPAQDFLPSSFSSWSAAAAATKLRPDALEQFAGADAAFLREYGAIVAERRAYSRAAETLTATLYRMRDPSGAYGAYTFLRTEEMTGTDLAPYSAVSRNRALVVIGQLLLDISGLGTASPSDLRALAAQLNAHADKTPYPTLGQYLPAGGLVSRSERYFQGPLALNRLLPLGNGDWIGFADGAEAQLGRYRVSGQEATLLLAAYPTPQAAARKLEELAHWFPLNATEEQPDGRPMLFARRSSSLLAIVAQTRSRAVADSILQQIRYENQVTWNEPRQKATDPEISQILVGTILGTGAILLFALAAGIGFGGVRLVVKYFLPGKVFDRPGTVEILQLGLTSKPIEGKDFY